jgi:DNA-binding beta-propeller fold protein YncE
MTHCCEDLLVKLNHEKEQILKHVRIIFNSILVCLESTNNLAIFQLQKQEIKEQEWANVQLQVQHHVNLSTQKVKLDIGGRLFSVSRSLLLSFEDSFFHAMLSSGRWLPRHDGTYAVNRDSQYFETMLQFMRTGHLNVPHLVDSEGNLHAGLIDEFDFYQVELPLHLLARHWKGQIVRYIGVQGTNHGAVTWPNSVSIIKDNIMVADRGTSQIKVFDLQNGKFVRAWPVRTHNPLDCSGLFCTVQMEKVYVSDPVNHRISIYSLTGQLERQWGCKGHAPGEFYIPHGIAVDMDNGNIVVADFGNYRIQCFDRTGIFIRDICFRSTNINPKQLVVFKGSIVLLDMSCTLYTIAGKSNEAILWLPETFRCSSLCMSMYGEVYVCEWQICNNISVFNIKGEKLRDLPINGLTNFVINFLAISPSGYMIACDTLQHSIAIIN